MLELPGAAVTVSYYAGYGIGTLIYDVWGTQINDALEQVFPYPTTASAEPAPAAASVPPMPPAANDTNFGDDGCHADCQTWREALNRMYQALVNAESVPSLANSLDVQWRQFNNSVEAYEQHCGPYTPPPSIHDVYTK